MSFSSFLNMPGGVRPQFWRPSCQAHLWTGLNCDVWLMKRKQICLIGWIPLELVIISISRIKKVLKLSICVLFSNLLGENMMAKFFVTGVAHDFDGPEA